MKDKHCICPIPMAGYSTTKDGKGFIFNCRKCGKPPKNMHPNSIKKGKI